MNDHSLELLPNQIMLGIVAETTRAHRTFFASTRCLIDFP